MRTGTEKGTGGEDRNGEGDRGEDLTPARPVRSPGRPAAVGNPADGPHIPSMTLFATKPIAVLRAEAEATGEHALVRARRTTVPGPDRHRRVNDHDGLPLAGAGHRGVLGEEF